MIYYVNIKNDLSMNVLYTILVALYLAQTHSILRSCIIWRHRNVLANIWATYYFFRLFIFFFKKVEYNTIFFNHSVLLHFIIFILIIACAISLSNYLFNRNGNLSMTPTFISAKTTIYAIC